MTNLVRISLSCSLAAAVAACSDYTDPGDGSGTLVVEASATYSPGDDNGMRLRVDISQDGEDVSDATVVFQDGDSTATFFADHEGGGRYEHRTGSRGYVRQLELRIERPGGDHGLTAKLEGPGPFRIDSPVNDGRVDLSDGDELQVVWVTEDGIRADEVYVELDEADYEDTDDDDDGHIEIPHARMKVGSERIDLRRTNRVELAGGAGSSSFRISYEASNDVAVVE